MSLEQLKKDRQKLEENIQKQLNDFSEKYEVIIKDVGISSTVLRNTTGLSQSEIYVNVKIEL